MAVISGNGFSDRNFMRTGGGVSFEERGAQPSDFTALRGYVYADKYAESARVFESNYPNWQAFADCFVMRRPIIQISGQQVCSTESFLASDLMGYRKVGFVNVKSFRIPGSDRCSVPGGKYQLTNLSFSDNGNGHTTVNLSYQQYGEWELVQIQDNPPAPSKGA